MAYFVDGDDEDDEDEDDDGETDADDDKVDDLSVAAAADFRGNVSFFNVPLLDPDEFDDS